MTPCYLLTPLTSTFAQPRSKDPDTNFPLDGVDLETVSGEFLASLLDSTPIIFQLCGTKVVRLSKTLAMKGGGNILPCEAEALRLVAAKSTIPAPRVHRAFQVPDSTKYFGTMGYIVMDYIDGQNLGDCWKDLSDEVRTDVAQQTAQIIRQMQSIVLPEPGPIGGGPCRGRFFTDYSAGSFNGKSEMEDWFNHKLTICKHCHKAPEDIPPFKYTKFVLVHQDISPRNLILHKSGRVWVIDWAEAGACPPAFESAALADQLRCLSFSEMVLSLIPRYPEEERQLKSIKYGLTIAAFA